MTTLRVLAALVAAINASASSAPSAGRATGYFRLGKAKSAFTSACAFRVPDDAGGGPPLTLVVLSDTPIDCTAADAGFDPDAAVRRQLDERKPAILTLTFSARGDGIAGAWSSSVPFDTMNFSGNGTFTLAVNTAVRVEGRYALAKPATFFDKTYQFDLTFAADVLSGAVTGTPLPANGGEPGETVRKYFAAIAKSDFKAMLALSTATHAEQLPDSKDAMDFFVKGQVKNPIISGGLLHGDEAAVSVSGTSSDNEQMRGRLVLRKEAGTWKVADVLLRMVI